jgi:hypothetical protein
MQCKPTASTRALLSQTRAITGPIAARWDFRLGPPAGKPAAVHEALGLQGTTLKRSSPKGMPVATVAWEANMPCDWQSAPPLRRHSPPP